MPTWYAMQFGLDYSAWEEGESGSIHKFESGAAGSIDMFEAMVCSTDGGRTWQDFVNGHEVSQGSLLKLFLYDLNECPAGFIRRTPYIFSRRSPGEQGQQPNVPWGVLGAGASRRVRLTEFRESLVSHYGRYSAPAWKGAGFETAATGREGAELRIAKNQLRHQGLSGFTPEIELKLQDAGSFSIGMQIDFGHSTSAGNRAYLVSRVRERELVVGGGQKASLQIRLAGEARHPDGKSARLSRSGRRNLDQVIFSAVDKPYTLKLVKNFWLNPPEGNLDLQMGETKGPYQLKADAPTGLQQPYLIVTKREHPPSMFIEP